MAIAVMEDDEFADKMVRLMKGGLQMILEPARAGWLQLIVMCARCKSVQSGALRFDDGVTVLDSEGFMLFNEGPVCDHCLGEA